MLPIREYFKSKSGEYLMTDQVSMIRVSIFKSSHAISNTTEKIFIEEARRNGTRIERAEFEAKYLAAWKAIQVYEISGPSKNAGGK